MASMGLILLAAGPTAMSADRPETAGIPTETEINAAVVQAKAVLLQVLTHERNWQQIHAAEALIAVGEGATVRAAFANDQVVSEQSDYRIGIWRVRAAVAQSPVERKQWLAKIEAAFCDPRSPDRLDAIESLSKLRFVASGETLRMVRQLAEESSEGDKLFTLWALALAEDPGAMERIIAALASADIFARQRAAYALRWLHASSGPALQALARATQAEPAGTYPYVYLLSAALALNADPPQSRDWQAKLEAVLASGPAPARFEAIQYLMTTYDRTDVLRLKPQLNDSECDTRIAAAWGMLNVHYRN